MTPQHTYPDGRGNEPPVGKHDVRLRLKPEAAKTGYVDGAWWPRGTDLGAELPAVLQVIAEHIGPVYHLAYRIDEWTSAPSELVVDGRSVQCSGHEHGTPHTIEALGYRDRRLVLLVVPPHTDPDNAFSAMVSASSADNETAVEELLTLGADQRHNH